MESALNNLILALETGLDGGNVSLLANERLIDFAEGHGMLSKSEDILPLIENLLKKNGIDKREIGLIAISDEPGSLTGIRIGQAIARGLGASLSAKVCQMPVLEALARQSGLQGRIVSALYTAKQGAFYQKFWVQGDNLRVLEKPSNEKNIPQLVDYLEAWKVLGNSIVLDEVLYHLAGGEFRKGGAGAEKNIICVKGNLAEIIGRAAVLKLRPIMFINK
jgi:tRNA threonylcarbamoyl adenosine modification protein YeaZ